MDFMLAEGGSIVIIRTLHSCQSFRLGFFFSSNSLINDLRSNLSCIFSIANDENYFTEVRGSCEAEIHSFNETTQYYGTIIICTARGEKWKFGANKPDSNLKFSLISTNYP